jgi:hypothetical protein
LEGWLKRQVFSKAVVSNGLDVANVSNVWIAYQSGPVRKRHGRPGFDPKLPFLKSRVSPMLKTYGLLARGIKDAVN